MTAGRPEILAPAGSYPIMKLAFQAGADAVYLGGMQYGARAYADNLTEEELLQGIAYAQLHHKKLYLTVNTLLKEKEIDRLIPYLKAPYEAGLDGVIVQDLGTAMLIRRAFPKLNLHISTQMSLMTPYGAEFLKPLGPVRLVAARELSIEELRLLKEYTGLELEVFVHGALCYSCSGQCLLSSMIGGRSGNRGRCAQPCRKLYTLSGRGAGYYLSPKDLCGLEAVPELIKAGIDSFKIEGRMKRPEYVIAAVHAYRQAEEACLAGEEFPVEAARERLGDIYNRGGFTSGYFHMHNGPEMMSMERNHHNGIPMGTVQTVDKGQISILLERPLNHGDLLEIRPTGRGTTGDAGDSGVIEVTAGREGRAGETVTLNARQTRRIYAGDRVYRTKNHVLCRQLLEKTASNRLKENVHISVILRKDLSAMIKMECNGRSVTVQGGRVEQAKNRPLTREEVLEKLQKLGDSPFQIASISLDMEEDCFYPMKEFNELRRQAAARLAEVCGTAGRRTPPDSLPYLTEGEKKIPAVLPSDLGREETVPMLAVGVSVPQQLPAVLSFQQAGRIDMELEGFSLSELPDCMAKVRQAGKQVYISLPRLFRMDMEPELSACMELQPDGYIVRNLDEAGLLQRYAPEARTVWDYNVYTYNTWAAACSRVLHPVLPPVLTLPAELNEKELKELLEQTPDTEWEWVIYGAVPVMATPQCLIKNTEGCRKTPGLRYLMGDHQETLRVQAVCRYCYNVVYREPPVCLSSVTQRLAAPNLRCLRIQLTTESPAQVRAILEGGNGAGNGNTGLFGKGME